MWRSVATLGAAVAQPQTTARSVNHHAEQFPVRSKGTELFYKNKVFLYEMIEGIFLKYNVIFS